MTCEFGQSRIARPDVLAAERAVNDLYRRLVDSVRLAAQPILLSLPIDNPMEFEGQEEEATGEREMLSKIQVTICCSASRAITLTITPEM